MKKIVVLLTIAAAAFSANAQTVNGAEQNGNNTNGVVIDDTEGYYTPNLHDLDGYYNPLSVRYNWNGIERKRVHSSDVMYKKTVYRKIDLREKQNQPFFSKGRELSRLICDAVLRDDTAKRLIPYKYIDDSSMFNPGFIPRMKMEDFKKGMSVSQSAGVETPEERAIRRSDDSVAVLDLMTGTPIGYADWTEWRAEWESNNAVNTDAFTIDAPDIFLVRIKESYIFDKERSRAYYDIQMLCLQTFTKEDNKDLGCYYYKDIVEKVFRVDPRAIWFNPANDQEHRTMEDAFDLRLFSSFIYKLSNPLDQEISEIYGSQDDPERAIRATYWVANDLMEFEHNLWEF